MAIPLQIWQNITFNQVEEIFFARPFWMQEYGSGGSTLGIYGFFEMKAGREYLRYIGKSTCLEIRWRGPNYHEHGCLLTRCESYGSRFGNRITLRVRNF